MMHRTWLLVFSFLCYPAENVLSLPTSVALTKDTYEELTHNKTVFISWMAPWCGHSQKLEPEWNQMAQEWMETNTNTNTNTNQDNKEALVAHVNCMTHQAWCVAKGITGFPTLLYGEPSHDGVFLQEYTGEKTYLTLSQFANETLIAPVCSPGHLEPCDGATRALLQGFWKSSREQLESQVELAETAISKAEQQLDGSYRSLQEVYRVAAQEHELVTAQLKRELKFLSLVKEGYDEFQTKL
jgi:thiol-disulfide isomerase/thioredoxin